METILIIAFSLALIIGYLLISKRGANISDRILLSYFIFTALTLLLAYIELINRKSGYPYPMFMNISTPFILLHGPLLYAYVKSLTKKKFQLTWIYALHLIPFFLVVVLIGNENISQTAHQRIAFETTNTVFRSILFPVVVALIAVSTQGYYIWGLMVLKQYRKRIKRFFSKVDDINLNWLRLLLIGSIVFHASISLLYALNMFFEFISYGTMQLIGFAIASILVLIIGVFGLKQGDIFQSVPERFNMDGVYDSFSLEKLEPNEEQFIRRLLEYVKQNEPYLNTEITISGMSSALNVSPDYLSKILNSRLNMNFFDFINQHRVDHFKRLLVKPENRNLTIITLAYDSGFSSKATFNRVFKNSTGLTPSQYLQEVSLK